MIFHQHDELQAFKYVSLSHLVFIELKLKYLLLTTCGSAKNQKIKQKRISIFIECHLTILRCHGYLFLPLWFSSRC